MIDGLQDTLAGIGETIKSFVGEKPVASALIGAGVVGTTALGGVALAKTRRKTKRKTKRKAKKKTKRGTRRDRKFISKEKHEATRRRKRPAKIYKKKGLYYSRKPLRKARKRTSKKRVGKTYYTKKGQPYKILASGKARFIKKTKRRTR